MHATMMQSKKQQRVVAAMHSNKLVCQPLLMHQITTMLHMPNPPCKQPTRDMHAFRPTCSTCSTTTAPYNTHSALMRYLRSSYAHTSPSRWSVSALGSGCSGSARSAARLEERMHSLGKVHNCAQAHTRHAAGKKGHIVWVPVHIGVLQVEHQPQQGNGSNSTLKVNSWTHHCSLQVGRKHSAVQLASGIIGTHLK